MASTNQVNVINNSAANQWRRYSVYKDSGIEWLGEIPGHWEVKRVKWITETHKQGYYTNQRYISKGVKLARITDIDDFANVSFKNMPFVEISAKYEELFKLQEGDFLFARSGTIGRFGLVKNPERSVFASYLIKFRFSNVDPKFLAFAFSSHFFKENLISTLHGGANQNVHAENIKEQLVPIPPLHEQKAIASFLDKETARIDALVAKKQRLLKLLKEKRTALISHAVTKGLDAAVAMKDSGIEWLGEIPRHWEVRRNKTLFRLFNGYAFKGEFFSKEQENTPVIVTPGNFLPEGNLYFTEGNTTHYLGKYPTEFELELGDMLIVMTDLSYKRLILGQCATVDRKGLLLNQRVAKIKINKNIQGTLDRNFLSYALNSSCAREQVICTARGSTVFHSSPDKIGECLISLPPLHEQKAIASHLDKETAKLDNLMEKIRQSIETQKEYRTALISAAVTGKIDVRSSDRLL